MSKEYGLIIPGQRKQTPAKAPAPTAKPSIFEESSSSASDDDADAGACAPRMRAKPGAASGPSLMERRVARRMQEKALAEDPTIFQYDELYDDMDNKREEAKESKRQEPRKPKYIGRLMEHAERRKLENELRIERQVQKDREAEGETFKDKDTYVTASYRKKLESIRQMQEQEQRDEYLEAIGDVTKQKDLDGFYRHLYEQKLGTEPTALKPKTAPGADDVAYKPIKAEAGRAATTSKQRSYRQRRPSEEEQEDQKPVPSADDDEVKAGPSSSKAHLTNNIDADSDFSIDDSSDDEAEAVEAAATATKVPAAPIEEEQPKQEQKKTTDQQADNEEAQEPSASATVEKQRINIWEKRTVGEAFAEALARYQQRKRARCG